MSDWQTWAVAVVLLLCVIRIIQGIYSFFCRIKEKRNPCESCTSVCELKGLYDKKRAECDKKRKVKKKKCCG